MCREHWARVSPATQSAVRRSRRRDVPLRDRVEAGRKALLEARGGWDECADAIAQVRAAGGEVVSGPYEFPGGRRFHFTDPAGNELGVWSSS